MEGKEELRLPIFDGTNYEQWKFRLKLLLQLKNCEQAIEQEVKTEPMTENDWKKIDLKAQNYVVNSISNSQLDIIIAEGTAYKMIKKLDDMYLIKGCANKLLLKRKILQTKFKDGNPLEFFQTFEKQINDLKGAGEKVTDEDKLNYLLLALPSKFENIVNIVDALPKESQTVEYVKSKLLLEYKKKETENVECSEQTFASTSSFKQTCYECNREGHFKRDCPKLKNSQRGQYRGRFHRGGRGYRSYRGRNYRGYRGLRGNNYNNDPTAGNSSVGFNVEVLTAEANTVNWLLDSGCSDHIVNDDRYFCEYKKLDNPVNIRVGDGFSLKSEKIGKITMHCYANYQLHKIDIDNVYYVPNMKRNLLSVSSIVNRGNMIKFQNEIANIYSSQYKLVAVARKKNKLYELEGKISGDKYVNTNVQEMSLKEKWHRMLGHVNYSKLKEMCRHKLLTGLPDRLNGNYIQCEICLQNKMTNLPFENNRRRATEILEIVHTDVNGPITPVGYNEQRYFVSFIDDYSRHAAVCVIKNKSEVFDCFRTYVNRMQNQTGKRVKEIRCDRGREYLNRDFYNFAKENGIFLNPGPAYTHELNGTAERYNRTIMDRARCLMTEAKLDKKYWPECVLTAAYLGNRILTNTAEKKSPFEIFYRRKPDVKYLRLYGSKCFVRVPEEKRTSKLNPKGVKGCLVGYTDTGYKVLVDNEIIISRHVIFIDSEAKVIKYQSYPNHDTDNEDSNGENRNMNEDKERTQINENEKLREHTDNNDEYFDTVEGEENEREKSNVEEVSEPSRPRRERKLPARLNDHIVYVNVCDVSVPETYEEAISSPQANLWKNAMNNEINSLEQNETWQIVDEPINKNIIEVKWIFRIKSNGIYKARVVAKGFQQVYDEYEEIYSPVARMTTMKALMSTACVRGWHIECMDVETAFLNGTIKSEVYIYPPDGYKVKDNKVCKLRKALYGLRESPRDWYECYNEFMLSINFKRSDYDYCLYTGCINSEKVYLCLYVDDILICAEKENTIRKVKQLLSDRFRMKDLGKVKQYLGIDIDYKPELKRMILSQCKYIESLAEKYNIKDSKKYETPMEQNLSIENGEINYDLKYRNLIGALLYVASATRPDVSYSVNFMSRFQNYYSVTHYNYALRILKYLYHSRNLALNFNAEYDDCLDAFVDADWAADKNDRKSTTGIILRVFNNPVMWKTHKQRIVSRASTHAEYYALADCVTEVLPVIGILGDLDVKISKPVKIYEDNSGAISLSKNGKFCKNSKHIDVSYHFVNDYEKKKVIDVTKINTDDQLADILTKALGKSKFQKLRQLINVY